LEITDDVTNTSFADWKTGYQQLECDMSVLANYDLRVWQHLQANNRDWKASMWQNTELWFFSFKSRTHSATTGASVNCNTFINNVKMFLYVSQ